ncbi:hypothetical protein Y88_1271 [Novosphingobium nitrogenifigens DSM 19370]|uniref:Uncharacterized protein n=1 Tax=Novosphingobium nitrogenifigens DSM 19370 TaxID=983920 RepID=F1Z816_9SPHN|nr:hypothetical protein [Novosphingobium nitrogenifigens]EGD59209.1 hypothetical protein Y88_1271 [Novosphingobium nitrogenifigens DSM 19370]
MRTTYEDATVRLYYLSDGPEGGVAQTLMYGPLSDAMALAAQQEPAVQDGLWIATSNDVVAWRDLAEG